MAANLTYRTLTQIPPNQTTIKDSPLTHEEMDGNFKSLDNAIEAVIAQVVPTGGAAGQVLAKASAADHDTEWVDQGSVGALAWDDVTDKPSTFPPEAHVHAIADVTGLQAELERSSSPTIPAFTAKTDATVGALTESNAVTVGGVTTTVWPALVRGDGAPEVQVNAGPWATSATFRAGDSLKLRNTAAVADLNYVANLYTVGAQASWTLASIAAGVERAAVVVLLGQSLNAPRGTTVQATGGTAGFAYMPAGGTSITDWDFFPTNATTTGHWNELASAVDYTEGALQSPGAGIAQQLGGGRYSRAYIGNVAIGARDLQTLMMGGPLNNAWATIFRLCEIARADGYVPEVMFYSAHGEANAASNTSEQAYYDLGVEYYGRVQLYAAQAMRNTAYVAPVLLTYPAQQANAAGNLGEQDRNIKEAIRRLCVDVPGIRDAGAIYQWPVGADRVHPEVGSYVLRGEHIGRTLRLVTAGTPPAAPQRITGVSLSGANFTITFSKPVVRDAALGVGQNLAVATAEDGIEWFDNGVALAINSGSLVYSGNTITGTLASTPTGTLAQQTVRIAEQYTSSTLTAGAANLSGSVVRSNDASWTANYLSTSMYDFAIPQRVIGVS